MGVHSLWELLAPVGRRVSVETLAGKKLAIDASIWMVQFMKAMRDEKGEMVRNAHLLGFFRRICKLLFLRTKPVFVFDGGTPALKRRTVIARRRQRENAQAKIRKMAEKLLLNHLKSTRLKELEKDLENQRKKNNAKGKKVLSDQSEVLSDNGKEKRGAPLSHDQEKVDEMLAASLAAEEEGRFANAVSTSNAEISVDENDGLEEIILPEIIENLDPTVLEALPPDLVAQIQGRSGIGYKAKQVLPGKDGKLRSNLDAHDVGSKIQSQEELDEILLASIAKEEGWKVPDYGLTSDPQDHFEVEDHEADEEMIIPEVHGNVDRDVLDSLPISMRLDLLAQMKERQMAENRQRYQKIKKAPEKFSELQIQSYLKSVSLRREINQVQKAAAGRGVGGVQTSRIASEANREFIFSSTFSGNKEILISSGAQTSKSREDQSNMVPHSLDSAPGFPSTSEANSVKESMADKSKKSFDHGVETFLDERGRVRVSRVRAMGIRMTRDLQRNLELMKEIDQGLAMRDGGASDVENAETMLSENNIGGAGSKNLAELSGSADCSFIDLNGNNENFVFGKEASIQISFEDDGETQSFDGDDQIFASLVAGNPLTPLSAEKVTAGKESSESESVDWQEGEGNSFSCTGKVDELFPGKSNNNEESDVEWEEGFQDICKDPSSYPGECGKHIWKGDQEEDADLQEAIRRSLKEQKSLTASEKDMKQERNGENNLLSTMFMGVDSASVKNFSLETVERAPQVEANFPRVNGGSDLVSHDSKVMYDIVGAEMQQGSYEVHNLGVMGALTNEVEKCQCSPREQDGCLMGGLCGELVPEITTSLLLEKEQVHAPADASAVRSGLSAPMDKHSKGDPCDRAFGNSCDSTTADDKIHQEDAVELQAVTEESYLPRNPVLACSSKLMDVDVGELKVQCNQVDSSTGRMHSKPDFPIKDYGNAEVEFTKENLEEEIQKLDQEFIDLGNERKKLERTAESVNNEMFTECQELLQMFGLPYIIAPMEAEAQCAYMEMENLVDGVVTDDSDVFLFGAQSVYKNIFDDRKYVETYFMKDIEKELGLTREKLIHMALLLGSDYTEGISGIGIVNAIEVVNAFPEENGLQKFREWVESPDPSILGKGSKQGASTLRKRGSNACSNGKNVPKDTMEGLSLSKEKESSSNDPENLADQIEEMKEHFMIKHRNVSKNWHIPANFPSEAVISAYTFPQVDKSTEPFSWGRPDHFVLRKLCWEKFGWGSQKADELLVPVLKEYNKHETQLRLEAFYSFNERFAKIRSKRIKKAVRGITGSQAPELMDDGEKVVRSAKKQKKSPEQPQIEKSKESSSGVKETVSACNQEVRSTRSTNKFPGGSSNCRGRGRGRGRKDGVKTSKRKATHGRADMNSSDDSSNDDEDEVPGDKLEGIQEVRRSARTRKQVDYIENEAEQDAFEPAENCCNSSYDVLIATQDCVSTQGTFGKNMDCQHHRDGDHLLQDGLSTDYLKMGGGFCLDEDDTDKQQLCNDDCSLPGTSKVHNLEMDADLCMDEADIVEEACGVPSRAMDDAHTSHCLLYSDKETHEKNSVQSASTPWFRPDETHDCTRMETSVEHHLGHLNAANSDSLALATSLQEDKTREKSGISYGALSALPFLRRKKRKG